MLDLPWLRAHAKEAQEGIGAKGYTADIPRILALDAEKRALQQRVEKVAAEKNAATKEIPKLSGDARAERLAALKKLDMDTDADRTRRTEVTEELDALVWQLPNLPAADVRVGENEEENEALREVGERPTFDFTLKAHWELGSSLNVFDVERGAKVSGARFAYLTGIGARLEIALLNHAMQLLTAEGFTPVIPPVLVKSRAMEAMGYTLHGGREESYYLDKDDLYLVGTSEQSLGPFHMGEVLEEKDLPKRYAAYSPCFRRESGSYGKDTKGMFRVHQFGKVEMFSFTTPEQSDAEHEYLLAVEERLLQSIGLPYRVVKMCTGDLGVPAARKYDLEAWFPSENRYRELTSTSSCTDWQARRLNIRYRPADGGALRFLHTLNGTAWSMNRPICAILENFQQADGSVVVPELLRDWVGQRIAPPEAA